MGIMRQAKNAGYQTFLVYISLGDPELHIERVRL
jgi:predicted ABC-type ATPase